MSSPPITDPLSVREKLRDRPVTDALARPLQRAAFWAAIALPFLHVPLLATGLDSRNAQLAFVVLLACNVAALVVGHNRE